jgi:hypothetical protein
MQDRVLTCLSDARERLRDTVLALPREKGPASHLRMFRFGFYTEHGVLCQAYLIDFALPAHLTHNAVEVSL